MTASPGSGRDLRRFTRERPCPVCGGSDDLPRGKGVRCGGFRSSDGKYAHCTRVECGPQEAGGTYAHRLDGPCRCGQQHGVALTTEPKQSRRKRSDFRLENATVRYEYVDAAAELVRTKARYGHGDEKTFRWFRPDGSLAHGGGNPEILYRLPEVSEAEVVHVHEGEKGADRLQQALADPSIAATCLPSPSGWTRCDLEPLRDRDLIVWRDRDDAGAKFAAAARNHLSGLARSLRIVESKTIGAGDDAFDHLEAGHTIDEAVTVEPESEPESEAAPQPEEPEAVAVEDEAASPTSDLANAHRLVRAHGRDLRWVRGLGWLVWTGTRWEESDTHALRLASRVGRLMHAEAAEIGRRAAAADEAERKRLGALAESLHAAARMAEHDSRIRGALHLATPHVELGVDCLDLDPWLLGCENGVVDLRTGRLRPHRRGDHLTRSTRVAYNPEARSELWEKVREKALPASSLRDFVQRCAGETAVGGSGADVMLLIHGPTRTAKGTVEGAVAAALGDYAITAGLEDLAERSRASSGPRPELVRLRGARMVSVYETSKRLRLSASLIKTLAGSDPICARGLHRDPIEFQPTFTLWLACNFRPRLPSDDDAVWERMREIPFRVEIPESERDPEVRRRLREDPRERAAVLAWIIQGALLRQRDGLAPPTAVREATAAYRAEMDPLGPFLRDRCELAPDAHVGATELLLAYEQWCKDSDEKPLKGKAWGDALRANGFKDDRTKTYRFWTGLRLDPAASKAGTEGGEPS